jgi:hypothetical protein
MAMARANNHFNWGCASITRMESMDMATDESKTAGVVLDEQGNLSNSAAFCSAPAPTRKVRSDKGVPKPKKTPAISGYGCISEDQAREIVRALFESGDYAAAVIVLKAMQEGNK